VRKISEESAFLAHHRRDEAFCAVNADHVSEGIKLVHSVWLQDRRARC
jgi:hypothetical protein